MGFAADAHAQRFTRFCTGTLPVQLGQQKQQTARSSGSGAAGIAPFVAGIYLAPPVSLPDSVEMLAAPVDFGGYFELVGVETAVTDEELQIDLWWQAQTSVGQDYVVFVYALDEDGNLVAQSDAFPAQGQNPTRLWQAGDITHDQHRLAIPQQDGLTILVGAYDPNTQERLTANPSRRRFAR